MITEHGLPIAAAVFLIGMVLYGHHRGFLGQCVSVGALVLTILLVKMAAPAATEFIRANPEIRDRAARTILNASGWQAPSAQEVQFPAAQRIAIENMKLPQSVKDILLENNNSEFYHILGVDQFAEYISTYLADMLINVVCGFVIFLLAYILIRILIRWLDLIARLPILCGLNQIAGALLGLAQGLLILWIAGALLNCFAATAAGQILEQQVNGSAWLSFLYQYNPLRILLGGFIKGSF